MGPGEVGNLHSVIPKPGIRMGLDGHPLVLDVRPVRGLVEDVGRVGCALVGRLGLWAWRPQVEYSWEFIRFWLWIVTHGQPRIRRSARNH